MLRLVLTITCDLRENNNNNKNNNNNNNNNDDDDNNNNNDNNNKNIIKSLFNVDYIITYTDKFT